MGDTQGWKQARAAMAASSQVVQDYTKGRKPGVPDTGTLLFDNMTPRPNYSYDLGIHARNAASQGQEGGQDGTWPADQVTEGAPWTGGQHTPNDDPTESCPWNQAPVTHRVPRDAYQDQYRYLGPANHPHVIIHQPDDSEDQRKEWPATCQETSTTERELTPPATYQGTTTTERELTPPPGAETEASDEESTPRYAVSMPIDVSTGKRRLALTLKKLVWDPKRKAILVDNGLKLAVKFRYPGSPEFATAKTSKGRQKARTKGAERGPFTETTKERHLKCEYASCTRVFKRKTDRTQHHMRHEVDKPNTDGKPTCPICHSKFATRKSMLQHWGEHPGADSHACFICDEVLIKPLTKSHIIKHLQHTRKRIDNYSTMKGWNTIYRMRRLCLLQEDIEMARVWLADHAAAEARKDFQLTGVRYHLQEDAYNYNAAAAGANNYRGPVDYRPPEQSSTNTHSSHYPPGYQTQQAAGTTHQHPMPLAEQSAEHQYREENRHALIPCQDLPRQQQHTQQATETASQEPVSHEHFSALQQISQVAAHEDVVTTHQPTQGYHQDQEAILAATSAATYNRAPEWHPMVPVNQGNPQRTREHTIMQHRRQAMETFYAEVNIVQHAMHNPQYGTSGTTDTKRVEHQQKIKRWLGARRELAKRPTKWDG